jgi:hypothetical protein
MAATLALTTKFNLDTGKFNFVDTSNYAAQVSPDTGIKGVLRITGPSGLVYANADYATPASSTADITDGGGFINNVISIPLDASGDVQEGTYLVEYKAYVTAGTDAGSTLTFSSTFTYTFDAPSISISQVVDCFNATFTSTDSTNYTVDGIAPTTTRTHSILDVADPSRTSSSSSDASSTVVYPNLYAGDYKTTISTLAVYVFTSYSVSVTISSNATYTVACASQSNAYCGIQSTWEAYETAKANGDIKQAATSLDLFQTLIGLYKLYELAVNQQQTADANTYLARIMTLGNFTSSCSLTSGQIVPVLVKGDIYKCTSATSNSITTGAKSFTVPANLSFQPGVPVRATDAANPSNYLEGTTTTYTGTTLSLSADTIGGSGTKGNWYINIGS